MNKYDLSILIPARNEMFLARTVAGILESIRGKTEIIVVLDGVWADPGIPDDPRVTIIYFPESIGQRAATNQACRLSQAKYVMKLDAHCILDEGFDLKMMMDMQDNWTMIPTMYNLHAFDWICNKCGNKWYQSPTPTYCRQFYDDKEKAKNPNCDNTTDFKRDIVFKPRLNKRSYYYRFDKTLHFKYWGDYENRPEAQGDIVEIMSAQGSCFMLTREKYWELDICDERHGSWGQQGVEVACKTWLSGGRLVTTKKTWYAHMFRTQGGDFGFPYPLSGSDVDKARKYSRELWEGNTWPKAIHSFEWLLEKFRPIPDWHDEILNQELVSQNKKIDTNKGIIFYTDNRVNTKIAHKVQDQIKSIGIPIVSASLKPISKMGKNIHMPLERGYLTMFKQQLAALEASTADVIFMCEHDVLYHPSHFDFVPPEKNVFYYNINVWKARLEDGLAVRVDVAQQVSGLVAYREFLIDEYKRRIARLQEQGEFKRHWGFEPGTKTLVHGGFSDFKAENYSSKFPNIDIRGDWNMTANRWSPDKYRNPENAKGWTESEVWHLDGWRIKPESNHQRVIDCWPLEIDSV